MDDPFPIIVPSPELVAVVRHGDVPRLAPEQIEPFVRPVVEGATPTDWLLTEDTLAFADVSVPLRYERWRDTWERSWILDPLSSLERLVSAAREFQVSAPSRTLLERILGAGTTGPTGDLVHAELDPDAAQRLAAVVTALRDAVADRGRTGYGLVDATPGRRRTGLTRGWSSVGGPETLVADRHVSVAIDGADGLTVTVVASDRGRPARVVCVQEVELVDDSVVVRGAADTLALDLHRGRVLSWLMPGCTRWRVRPVPEVLVWAKTFAGIVDSAELAYALGRPVTLTSLGLSDAGDDPARDRAPRRLESSFDQEP